MNEKANFIKRHFMNIEEINEETLEEMAGCDGIIIVNSKGKIIDIEIGQTFTEDGFPLYWIINIWESYEQYIRLTGSIEYKELITDFSVEKLKYYVSM